MNASPTIPLVAVDSAFAGMTRAARSTSREVKI
jgi:hypothetical protein